MASQTIQGWHPNPQLMQPSQHAPPPQGWTGNWPPAGSNVPFPPGYPGPPPAPGGAAAHPRWNAGFWQYNPLANVQGPQQQQQQQQQQQPWAPGVGWFPPNFNPYKRVPKPPSPSYWNTKLSDNGLGLEGMVKRKEPSEYHGEEPKTPWIWNPPSLLESGDRATPARDFNLRRTGSVDANLRHVSTTPTREHGQSTRGLSQDSASVQAHSQTPDRRPSTRGGYFYNAHDNATTPSGPTRHSSDPSDFRFNQSGGSFAGPSTSGQRPTGQPESWLVRARSQPPAANEVPPFPAPTPTNPTSRSASVPHNTFTQEPESFTSGGDLRPTFSSSIIRTPTHYHQARRSTDELVSSHHSRSPSSAGHSSTPSRGPPVPEPLTRQSSLPSASSSTRDVYANLTEDLSNSLNASTSASSRAWSSSGNAAGPLLRSRTEPVVANLTTIHEAASAVSSGEMFLAPLRDLSSASSAESSPDPSPRRRDRRASPYSPEPSPLSRDRRPSPYTARHTGSHSHSPSPSPHTRTHMHDPYAGAPGSRRDNPLPPPPVERASLETSRPPAQEPSPPRYARKVRVGFWNRRGDHLTPNSYVVYAPHDRAYPEELRDYPDEREGYRDRHGSFAPWREDRPELPASLPYHGRPPAQPYESFVVYAYIQ